MCGTCGCGEDNKVVYTKPDLQGLKPFKGHSHVHQHNNDEPHEHYHEHTGEHEHHHSHEIKLEIDVFSKNNVQAERNRGYFDALNIRAFNLVSSPGSGKTSLLERTIRDLLTESPLFVIEGDQQTTNDAQRIKKAGAPVIQINTGNGCHLDAQMINHAVKELKVNQNSYLFIENVGNLVCPSLFDLGEKKRVVIISVTEGDDKPIKYPTMFSTSHLCIINKIDLIPYVDFDIEKAKEYARSVNPQLEFICLSAKTGEGMHSWLEWVKNN